MTGTRHSQDPDELNEWGMPKIREPDFSDVRRRVLAPWRLVVVMIVAILMWLVYYHFFPIARAPVDKNARPAATDSQK